MSYTSGHYSSSLQKDGPRRSLAITPTKRRHAESDSTSQEFVKKLRKFGSESKALRESISEPPPRIPLQELRVIPHTPKQPRRSLPSQAQPRTPLRENRSFNNKVLSSVGASPGHITKSGRLEPKKSCPLVQPLGLGPRTPAGKSRFRNSIGVLPKSALKSQRPKTRSKTQRHTHFLDGLNGLPYDSIKYYTPDTQRSSGPSPVTTMHSKRASRSNVLNGNDKLNKDQMQHLSQAPQPPKGVVEKSPGLLTRTWNRIVQLMTPPRSQEQRTAPNPSEPAATPAQITLPSSPTPKRPRSWSEAFASLSPFKPRPSSDTPAPNLRAAAIDSKVRSSFDSQIGPLQGGGRGGRSSVDNPLFDSMAKASNELLDRNKKGKSQGKEKAISKDYSDDELGGPGMIAPFKPRRKSNEIKNKLISKPSAKPSTLDLSKTIEIPSRRESLWSPDSELAEELVKPPLQSLPFREKLEVAKSQPQTSTLSTPRLESPNQPISRHRHQKREDAAALKRRIAERERRKAEAKAAARERMIIEGPGKVPSEVQIHSLSKEWEEELHTKMKTRPTTVLAKSPRGDDITRYAFGRVCPQRGSRDDSSWLNDVVIDSYLQHLSRYANGESEDSPRTKIARGSIPRVHCFNSFFWKKIRNAAAGESLTAANTWARKANIGTWDKLKQVEWVFIPVNENDVHWTLLVVSPRYRRIEYFDSFGGKAGRFVEAAKAWVQSEYVLSIGTRGQEPESLDGAETEGDLNFADWHIGKGETNQQDNGSDCGMFTIMNARMLALGWRPADSVGPKDMPLARRRVLCELLNGGLIGEFMPNDGAVEPFDWDVDNLPIDEVVDTDTDEDESED